MENVALVTGASGALGRAIAERLALDGYRLALHHFNNGVDALAESLRRRDALPAAALWSGPLWLRSRWRYHLPLRRPS